MSVIASAYKLAPPQLLDALKLLDTNRHDDFWKRLKSHEIGILPYSGYVMAAVIAYARRKGIVLPDGRRLATLSSIQRKELGIVACGVADDYRDAAKAIAVVEATDQELHQYYNELYAHDWQEAATAMRKGFAFILQGIQALNSDDELLMFSIV